MLHLKYELFQDIMILTITAGFYLLKNQQILLRNYLDYLISKVNKEFGNFAGRLLNNIYLARCRRVEL